MDYSSNTNNTKSIPISIINSPKISNKVNNINNYQYNETSFDPCSGSPPNDNKFILKLEHRVDKLNNNK